MPPHAPKVGKLQSCCRCSHCSGMAARAQLNRDRNNPRRKPRCDSLERAHRPMKINAKNQLQKFSLPPPLILQKHTAVIVTSDRLAAHVNEHLNVIEIF